MRKLQIGLLVAWVALLGGCAAEPGDTILELTFDVCQPVSVVSPGATLAEQASIDAALEMWRARGLSTLAHDELGDDAAAQAAALGQQVEIVFEPAAPLFNGLYDDEHGVVYINRNLTDDHARAVTIAHELGHAFGLWHIEREDRISVMNPANLEIEPNLQDADDLTALWGNCDDGS